MPTLAVLWPSSNGAVGFMEVDKALGSSRIDCEFSGSTSVVSFLKGKTLTTAWVGDSRGVLGRSKKGGGYEAVPLTKDHKPTAPEEKARIVATNGRVERSASTHTFCRTYSSALPPPCSWVTMAGQCDKVVGSALPVVRCLLGCRDIRSFRSLVQARALSDQPLAMPHLAVASPACTCLQSASVWLTT